MEKFIDKVITLINSLDDKVIHTFYLKLNLPPKKMGKRNRRSQVTKEIRRLYDLDLERFDEEPDPMPNYYLSHGGIKSINNKLNAITNSWIYKIGSIIISLIIGVVLGKSFQNRSLQNQDVIKTLSNNTLNSSNKSVDLQSFNYDMLKEIFPRGYTVITYKSIDDWSAQTFDLDDIYTIKEFELYRSQVANSQDEIRVQLDLTTPNGNMRFRNSSFNFFINLNKLNTLQFGQAQMEYSKWYLNVLRNDDERVVIAMGLIPSL